MPHHISHHSVIITQAQPTASSSVYTSTVNVAFFGDEVLDGSEADSSKRGKRHLDVYSETKHLAEQVVLSSREFRTCSLRWVAESNHC